MVEVVLSARRVWVAVFGFHCKVNIYWSVFAWSAAKQNGRQRKR
jgi:hypothetical protein